MTLLLARYGLDDDSVLCIDPKPHRTEIGHADGIYARTLEVLATVGLEHKILRYGRRFTEIAEWHRTAGGELERRSCTSFSFSPARYGLTYGTSQGRIEKVLSDDLARYVKHGVEYGSKVLQANLNGKDPEYPGSDRISSRPVQKGHRGRLRASTAVQRSCRRKCVAAEHG